MKKTKKTRKVGAARGPWQPALGVHYPAPTLSPADWRDIYDALMDAANWYHSGSRADRTVELARKIREEVLP